MHIKKLHLVSCADNWLCSPLFLFKTGCSMQLLKEPCAHTHLHTGFFITPQIFLNKSCCLDFKLFFSLQHENHPTLGSAAFWASMIQKFNKSISGFLFFFFLLHSTPFLLILCFLSTCVYPFDSWKASVSNTAGILLSKRDYSWPVYVMVIVS